MLEMEDTRIGYLAKIRSIFLQCVDAGHSYVFYRSAALRAFRVSPILKLIRFIAPKHVFDWHRSMDRSITGRWNIFLSIWNHFWPSVVHFWFFTMTCEALHSWKREGLVSASASHERRAAEVIELLCTMLEFSFKWCCAVKRLGTVLRRPEGRRCKRSLLL